MKYKILVLSRIILGLTFVFSGFVKAVDPWGGAIKISEYLSAFNLDFLQSLDFVLAVSLSTLELALGLMLFFGVWKKWASALTVLFMSFFTLLTLWIAVTNPVADCGCFGDAVKLTAWETFFKNFLILLPLSIYVFISTRNKRYYRGSQGQNIAAWAFVVLGIMISLEAYFFLPPLDFRPYKVGVNISESMNAGAFKEVETVLIYKNIATGENVEFSLSDTTWYDDTVWEYVDTQMIEKDNSSDGAVVDFAVYDNEINVSDYLLSLEDLIIITITDLEKLGEWCVGRLNAYISEHKDASVVVVTPISGAKAQSLSLGGSSFPIYSIDGTTLKTIIRAKNGLVRLNDGVIVEKRNCLTLF